MRGGTVCKVHTQDYPRPPQYNEMGYPPDFSRRGFLFVLSNALPDWRFLQRQAEPKVAQIKRRQEGPQDAS